MSLNSNAAFPIQDSNPYAKGLTKREMFAMAAMQGILSREEPTSSIALASEALTYAEALLSALEQGA